MRIVFFISTFLILNFATAQDLVKNYYPIETVNIDLSQEAENEILRRNVLFSKDTLNASEAQELDAILLLHDETVETIWDAVHGGCSWYCGGGNYATKASSALPTKNQLQYDASKANDLSYKTAWVEGVSGSGIGEYLAFYFKNNSPRVTKIIISNGYVKSESAWSNNNRVKRLKIYINETFAGVLNLQDTKADQYFELGTLGHNKDGSDLVLKFEILEVYRGDKYDDTAITEIYFDGTDVH